MIYDFARENMDFWFVGKCESVWQNQKKKLNHTSEPWILSGGDRRHKRTEVRVYLQSLIFVLASYLTVVQGSALQLL